MASGKQRTYKDVKELVESANYKLLSKENEIINNKGFVLAKTYLLVWCKNPNHKPKNITLDKFIQGVRCRDCRNEENRKNKAFTYDFVKESFEKEGYKLLSTDYKNSNEHLTVECPKGHLWEKCTFYNFKQGHKCPHCYGNVRHTYQEVKEYIESFGYELLSKEYINAQEKLKVKCPNGHEYKVAKNNFQQGQRCPICNISKGEQRIMDYLNKNDIGYIYNEPYFKDLFGLGKGLLRPDFIIEDRKVWIEFDGKFHYEKMYEDDYHERLKEHDKIKNEYAKKK